MSTNGPRHHTTRRKNKDLDMGLTIVLVHREVMDKRIQLPNGTPARLGSVSNAAFREWFYHLCDRLEQLYPRVRDIGKIRTEAQKLQMDESTRWYLINEIYRLHCYQSSGISMFVEDERVAS